MREDIAVIGCVRDRFGRAIPRRPAGKGFWHDLANTTGVGVVVTRWFGLATDAVVYGVFYGVLAWVAPRLEWSSQDGRRACAATD